MSQINHNRASYQHVPNIHLGNKSQKLQILTGSQRLQAKSAITMLENALRATSKSFADVNVTNAYRECRSLCNQRIASK